MKMPVFHRFSAVLLLSTCVTFGAAAAENQDLFNGTDLTGWDGNPKLWSVRDGAITGQTTPENPTKGNTFLIWTNGVVDDFEFRCSYRMVGGNSGVQYRSKVVNPKNWVAGGYQADFEAGKTYSGILYDEAGVAGNRGIMAGRGEIVVWNADCKKEVKGSLGKSEEIQAKIKHEDWNEYVIIAKGNRLQHFINGTPTVDVTDNCEAKRLKSGVLALQLHAGPPMLVQFKNIQLKSLKSSGGAAAASGTKKIVLVAGRPSHGPGEHEHRAGCLLFQKCLSEVPGITSVVYSNGWPDSPTAFEGAAAVITYADGGSGHPFIQQDRLTFLSSLIKQGVGFGAVHYGCEVPKEKGGKEFLDWMGGYFEMHWSVNPHWDADFKKIPQHEVTRGVNPFKIRDEWYYHMRFQEGMKGVTPILTDLPPKDTLNRPDGPHSGNPAVRKAVLEDKEPQHVMWLFERPDGGRGFGFTGGHFHKNWGQEDFRKVVLNAILWIAKADVPTQGVESTLSTEELKANQDPKGRR